MNGGKQPTHVRSIVTSVVNQFGLSPLALEKARIALAKDPDNEGLRELVDRMERAQREKRGDS